MTKPTRTRKSRKIEDLIDPAAENATCAAELGVVGHAPIDVPLYSTMDMAIATDTSPEIEAIVAGIEASEGTASEELTPADVADTMSAPQSFDTVIANFTEAQIEAKVFAIADAIDDRAAFEKAKDPDNANIHRTLKKVRTQLVTKRAAKVMLACNVSEGIINRTLHEGARYNVYALSKLGDVVFGVSNSENGTAGVITNAINLACMRSLFRMRKADKVFTGEIAKACASDKVRSEAVSAVKAHLVRHTVSESTAPTQASSTMQALETLGVVARSGSSRNPTYTLTDHPIVAKIEEMLSKAA